ncbi:SDR family oxidoreductase [Telmatospirillum siberiense]|uniref:Gluconate 5-dehydrogenase n=1 Tax=Telmatospirillum siberiense TaxID=382514 RepID=A0A2N3PXV9_9PROT|nr:SDR family oxidoreductase [Telmatospirillum siberiense]PKU25236.1 gluconate 5-dehydrogenase [Telmatospirillum siberiense]
MSNALFDLAGRTALVTGSTRGLGHSFAEGLAEAGAAIVLNGRDPASVSAAAAALRDKGHSVYEAAFDVTDEAGVEAAFGALDAQGIAIDILVNNAGIQLRKPIVDLSLAEWQKVIDTNLTSAFLVGRETARRMIARGQGGKIVNIGSLTSDLARATVAPYTAAKGGIKLLTKAMTAEWAEQGITVNAIGPGYMITEMTQPLVDTPSFDNWVKQRTPARRWGRPADLVGTVVYLASPASDFVNGQIIYVDGGIMAVL